MTKIIEYEAGRFQGHPVVIRFANVSEDKALYIAETLANRLASEFNAVYPLRHPSDYLLAEWPSESSKHFPNRARVSPGYEDRIPFTWRIIPQDDRRFYGSDERIFPQFMSLKRYPQDFPELSIHWARPSMYPNDIENRIPG